MAYLNKFLYDAESGAIYLKYIHPKTNIAEGGESSISNEAKSKAEGVQITVEFKFDKNININ